MSNSFDRAINTIIDRIFANTSHGLLSTSLIRSTINHICNSIRRSNVIAGHRSKRRGIRDASIRGSLIHGNNVAEIFREAAVNNEIPSDVLAQGETTSSDRLSELWSEGQRSKVVGHAVHDSLRGKPLQLRAKRHRFPLPRLGTLVPFGIARAFYPRLLPDIDFFDKVLSPAQ